MWLLGFEFCIIVYGFIASVSIYSSYKQDKQRRREAAEYIAAQNREWQEQLDRYPVLRSLYEGISTEDQIRNDSRVFLMRKLEKARRRRVNWKQDGF